MFCSLSVPDQIERRGIKNERHNKDYDRNKRNIYPVQLDVYESQVQYETIECYEARKAIRAIPSADRPQGEWVYCEDDDGQEGYRCSECGFFVPWYYDYEDSNYILDYKACPHCLARMKGADDDSDNI